MWQSWQFPSFKSDLSGLCKETTIIPDENVDRKFMEALPPVCGSGDLC